MDKKADKVLKIGDFVNAKVNGRSRPVKVMKLIKKKNNVYFYGSGETGNIKLKDLFMHEESKEMFVIAKNMKRFKLLITISQIENERVVGPPRQVLSNQETNRIEELLQFEKALVTERDFILHSLQLRDSWNVYLCHELIKQIKNLKLNKLMLLRNAKCVNIIRGLCHYEGNLNSWKKGNEDLMFNRQEKKMRDAALELYGSFKKLFGGDISEAHNFWERFLDEVEIYKKCTKNMKNDMKLKEEDYDKLVETMKQEAAENVC